jgi:hypothetical protein
LSVKHEEIYRARSSLTRGACVLGRGVAIVIHHPSESEHDGIRSRKRGWMEHHLPNGISGHFQFVVHTVITALATG